MRQIDQIRVNIPPQCHTNPFLPSHRNHSPWISSPVSSSASSTETLRALAAGSPPPAGSCSRVITTRYERRKTQNRDAQRAYRARNKEELAILHDRIPVLEREHRLLVESHAKQSAELSELRKQVAELTNNLGAIWAGLTLA